MPFIRTFLPHLPHSFNKNENENEKRKKQKHKNNAEKNQKKQFEKNVHYPVFKKINELLHAIAEE